MAHLVSTALITPWERWALKNIYMLCFNHAVGDRRDIPWLKSYLAWFLLFSLLPLAYIADLLLKCRTMFVCFVNVANQVSRVHFLFGKIDCIYWHDDEWYCPRIDIIVFGRIKYVCEHSKCNKPNIYLPSLIYIYIYCVRGHSI